MASDWSSVGCSGGDVRYLCVPVITADNLSTNGLHIPSQFFFCHRLLTENTQWSSPHCVKHNDKMTVCSFFLLIRLLYTGWRLTSVERTSKRGDRGSEWEAEREQEKGSLWQKHNKVWFKKRAAPYISKGVEKHMSGGGEGDKLHLQQVFSSVIHLGLRGQGLYPRINTHSMTCGLLLPGCWSYNAAVLLQMCVFATFSNLEEAFRPVQGPTCFDFVVAKLRATSFKSASHRCAVDNAEKYFCFWTKKLCMAAKTKLAVIICSHRNMCYTEKKIKTIHSFYAAAE